MNLNNVPKIVATSKKRLGRGHGSGKGKTAGRGTKGQKARGKVRKGFEGGQSPLVKRLPYLRGKRRNKSRQAKASVVSVAQLNGIPPSGTTVTLETLKKYRIIDEDVVRVKILAGGELTIALTVSVPCSKSAKEIILRAGGSIG